MAVVSFLLESPGAFFVAYASSLPPQKALLGMVQSLQTLPCHLRGLHLPWGPGGMRDPLGEGWLPGAGGGLAWWAGVSGCGVQGDSLWGVWHFVPVKDPARDT